MFAEQRRYVWGLRMNALSDDVPKRPRQQRREHARKQREAGRMPNEEADHTASLETIYAEVRSLARKVRSQVGGEGERGAIPQAISDLRDTLNRQIAEHHEAIYGSNTAMGILERMRLIEQAERDRRASKAVFIAALITIAVGVVTNIITTTVSIFR